MITEICKQLNFPQEATKYLDTCYNTMMTSPTVRDDLFRAMDQYFCADDSTHEEILKRASEQTNIHPQTVDMVFLLMCARPLRYIYHQNGLSEDLYIDTMCDLQYKLLECKRMYGIWGTFVGSWFRNFYLCKRFKLGRLQYERIEFPFENYKGMLKHGDTVYNCHIPSCGSLAPDTVLDSLKRAYVFYRDELKDGILPVFCSSWLLYPPHAELFPANSNMRKFYELFNILSSKENEDNKDFWRVFYIPYSPEALNSAPTETTLQRNFKEFLQNGHHMGSSKGILLFDGENIL